MAATQINLDDEALAEAARVLGTATKVSTVNAALRAVVAQQRQRDAILAAVDHNPFEDLAPEAEAWS